MLGSTQNQRDTVKDTSESSSVSPVVWYTNIAKYKKTNKLITALYMVTDTMEKGEPIRVKLRTLAVEILSDLSIAKNNVGDLTINKIEATMSLLSIATEIGIVSEMNTNILLKEFSELRNAILEINSKEEEWLSDFMKKPMIEELPERGYLSNMSSRENKGFYKGHIFYKEQESIKDKSAYKGQETRLGVQKANTLMDALQNFGNKNSNSNKRQNEILDIIKDNEKDNKGLTITDIKSHAKGELAGLGKKTLQRELVAMVEAGTLRKEGSKRWSRYLINTPQ